MGILGKGEVLFIGNSGINICLVNDNLVDFETKPTDYTMLLMVLGFACIQAKRYGLTGIVCFVFANTFFN